MMYRTRPVLLACLAAVIAAGSAGAVAAPKPVDPRREKLQDAFIRSDLAYERRRARMAGYYTWIISGEILVRDGAGLVVWGRASGDGAPPNHPGWMLQEGNIRVTSPDPQGVAYNRYGGRHYYLGEGRGTNAFGASVPCKVFGGPPRQLVTLAREAESLRIEAARAAGALEQYVCSLHEKRKAARPTDAQACADFGHDYLALSMLFHARGYKTDDANRNAMRQFRKAAALYLTQGKLDSAVSLLSAIAEKGVFTDGGRYYSDGNPKVLEDLLRQLLASVQKRAAAPNPAEAQMLARTLDASKRLQSLLPAGILSSSVSKPVPGYVALTDEERGQLMDAAQQGDLQRIEQFLARGNVTNLKDQDGWTPLHFAVQEGHLDVSRLLVSKGANINARTAKGLTPLHLAVRANQAQAATLLLEAGAKVDPIAPPDDDAESGTPLLIAVGKGNAGLVRLLLDKGANPNVQVKRSEGLFEPITSWSPLWLAIRRGNVEIAEALLTRGADAKAPDGDGRTPLHQAVALLNAGMVPVLLGHGADIEARDRDGKSPLHCAVEALRNPEMVSAESYRAGAKSPSERAMATLVAVLAGNPNLNARDPEGNTALHLAVALNHRGAAALLVQKGANADARNKKGESPSENGLARLLQQGAD